MCKRFLLIYKHHKRCVDGGWAPGMTARRLLQNCKSRWSRDAIPQENVLGVERSVATSASAFTTGHF